MRKYLKWKFGPSVEIYFKFEGTLFHKNGKNARHGSGTSHKDRLCPKLEKNPFKAKIRPSEYFIWYFMAIFKEKQRLGICNFWLKSAPKLHFIQLFYCTRHFHNKNLPQYAVWGQGIGKTKLCIELWRPLYIAESMLNLQNRSSSWATRALKNVRS